MAKATLSEIKSLGDALTTECFRFEMPLVPGVGINAKLGLKCQSCVIPGLMNERPIKELFGSKVPYRGPRVTSNQIDLVYLEDTKLDTYNTIRGWMDYMVDPLSGDGTSVSLHATVALLYIFDPQGNTITTHTFWNVFPIAIQDIQLDGTQTAPVLVHASFSFDLVVNGLQSLTSSLVNRGVLSLAGL